jgi:4-amino-4-deoxy-L-arabinose transferase-like glycosyltransferase
MPKTIFFVVLAAFAIRLAAVPLVHRAGYTSDEREYVTIAQRIISGEGFLDSNGFRSVRAPLYPALLALVLMVAGVPVAHVLGCALGSIAVYQAYRLAVSVWGDRTAALGAAAAMCVHPGLVIYSTLLQTEILYICFLLAALTAGYELVNGEGGVRAIVLGAASGFAALTRAVYLGFFPLLLAVFWWMRKERSSAGFGNTLVAAAVCALILAPWAFRNLQIHGSWIPVSSGAGGSLLTGNNPYATGTWRNEDGFEQWFKETAHKEGIDDPNALGEVESNRLCGAIAREYMRDHPGRTLGLALKKSQIFWVYPITHSDSYLPVQAVAVGVDALLLLGAALGAVAGWKHRRQLLPLFLAIAFFWLVQAVLHAEARFRLPLVPILCVLFGYGAATLVSRDRLRSTFALQGPRIAFCLCAAGIVVVYGFTGWMFLRGMIQ